MAYLKADKSMRLHAERQGLFVICATGSSAAIVNDREFEPRVRGAIDNSPTAAIMEFPSQNN